MVTKIDITSFLELAGMHPILDVRSPSEYSHAHMPYAHNMPLFTDEERKVVGTAYKQQNRQIAIKIGLDYFGPKMRRMVEDAEEILKQHHTHKKQTVNTLLVHCWRGGMRSAGVAWLLDLYGYKVYTLAGGYKAYRQWVLQQFLHPYTFRVLGGYTGSGKTYLLQQLMLRRQTVIDLEGIAHHKGSAFGALGNLPQPSQEQFENNLAAALVKAGTANQDSTIWVEDESRRIGDVNLPEALWNKMRLAPVYFLDIPFEERLDFLVKEYGKFKKEELASNIMRLRKRLGGLETKNAIGYLIEGNFSACFGILLRYYDKVYKNGLYNREDVEHLLNTLPCNTVDPVTNSRILLNLIDNNNQL